MSRDVVEIPIPTDSNACRLVDACVDWGIKLQQMNERLQWLADNDWWEESDSKRYDREVVDTLAIMLAIHFILDILKGLRDPDTLKRYTFKLRTPSVSTKELHDWIDDLYIEALREIQQEEDSRLGLCKPPKRGKRARRRKR